jgi:hypothetical protein
MSNNAAVRRMMPTGQRMADWSVRENRAESESRVTSFGL